MITSSDFLYTNSTFCNQHYPIQEEKALKAIKHRLSKGAHYKIYSETFLQGTPINEVKSVCPHLGYITHLDVKAKSMFKNAVPTIFNFLLSNSNNEMIASIDFFVHEDNLGFRSFGTGGPGTHSIARVIAKASAMPELDGYEMRALQALNVEDLPFGLSTLWFHKKSKDIDERPEDIISPIQSYHGLKEGHFYTEEEFLSILGYDNSIDHILVEQVTHGGL